MRTLLRFASLVLLYIILGLCFCSSAFGEEGNFIIPKNTLRIEDEAFRDCTEMTSVTIPRSVLYIGNDAFSGCVNLSRIYYEGTQAQWQGVSIAAGNEPLSTAMCVFLGDHAHTMIVRIGGKNYTANYFGRVDISSWSEKDAYREFWRLENAYDDFKDTRRFGDNLPESNYPMPVEVGKIYVIDYFQKDGRAIREVMRCDGNLWEGQLHTHAIAVDAPIHTEIMSIGGKNYIASYFGQWYLPSSEQYSCRSFWRLENAYDDLKNFRFAGEGLLERNYPMLIRAGEVYVIDYTLRSGGTERKIMRNDGNLWEGQLQTQAIIVG